MYNFWFTHWLINDVAVSHTIAGSISHRVVAQRVWTKSGITECGDLIRKNRWSQESSSNLPADCSTPWWLWYEAWVNSEHASPHYESMVFCTTWQSYNHLWIQILKTWAPHSLIFSWSRILSSLAHPAQHLNWTFSLFFSSMVTNFTNSSCQGEAMDDESKGYPGLAWADWSLQPLGLEHLESVRGRRKLWIVHVTYKNKTRTHSILVEISLLQLLQQWGSGFTTLFPSQVDAFRHREKPQCFIQLVGEGNHVAGWPFLQNNPAYCKYRII